MHVDLEVRDPNEDREIVFSDYNFTHVGCGPMTNSHTADTSDNFILRCNCGLEIRFPQLGDAWGKIVDAVIDRQPRSLDPETFVSDQATSVRVHPQDAA